MKTEKNSTKRHSEVELVVIGAVVFHEGAYSIHSSFVTLSDRTINEKGKAIEPNQPNSAHSVT